MMTESQDVPQEVGRGGRHHSWTHILAELMSMEDLSIPLRGSARLRYTCISVSRRYIALGANTGAVYIFGRENLKHLQVVLAEKESSPVTQVCFGPIDNVLAYACSNGNIIVVELNIERRSKPERVRLSVEHSGTTVTALQWDTTGGRLFSGDNLGKISVAFVQSSKAKDLFQHPSEAIVRVDSAVVQLDWSGDRLLVSTVTRCYLCYTSRQQYSQIGKRLRDGQFGACFYPGTDGQTPSIYCARPGSRVWEVDFNGNVLNTHQFKQLLAIPSFPIINCRSTETKLPDKLESGKPQSLTFPKLLHVSDTFLFTWSQNGLYVLDPVAVKVITWCKTSAGKMDAKCFKNEVYLFTEASGQVQKLSLLPVQKCVSVLILKEYWSLAGQLCAYFDKLLVDSKSRRYLPHSALNELYQQLLHMEEMDVGEKVKAVMSAIENQADSADDNSGIVRLDSGIYQVHDGKKLESDEDSPHTPSSVHSLSRHSSTSSLQAITDQMSSKRSGESGSAEVKLTVCENTEQNGGVETVMESQSQDATDSRTEQDVQVLSTNVSENSEYVDIVAREHVTRVYSIANTVTDKNVTDTAVTDSKDTNAFANGEALNSRVPESYTDTPMPTVAKDTSFSEEQKHGGITRKGSTSSLSSLSSNDLVMDQVAGDPVAVSAGRADSGKKSGRKKRASQPVIQNPGEKTDNKGQVRRSISSSGSHRKHGFRRRATSDLGPTSAIQEAIMEVDKQESISAEIGSQSEKPNLDQITLTLPTVPYSSFMMRSSSPINSQDTSPSQSPLVQSWEGSPNANNISGPKTALKSVKDSLSSKFSFTKKNLIRTIKEKKTKFVSRDLNQGRNQSPDEVKLSGGMVLGINKETVDGRQSPAGVENEVEEIHDELSPLRQATLEARVRLQQADILLQPNDVLSVWLKHLHLTLQQTHTMVKTSPNCDSCAQNEVGSVIYPGEKCEVAGHPAEVTDICDTPGSMSLDVSQDDVLTEANDRSGERDGQLVPESTNSHVLSETISRELHAQSDIGIEQAIDQNGDMSSPDQPIAQVKDADSVSVDSGHPIADGQIEDTGSDVDILPSTDQVDEGVPDRLNSTETDHSITLSSYSSGMSESFPESPTAFTGEFKTQGIPDSPEQISKTNSQSKKDFIVEAGHDFQQCHISPPFKSEQPLSSDLSYLANICFELGLHGRISDYLLPVKKNELAGNMPDSETEQNTDRDVTVTGDSNPAGKQQSDLESGECIDQTSGQWSDQSSVQPPKDEEDKELGLFLRNYFSYLDIAKVTKSLNSNGNHGYQTWLALVDCLKEKVKGDSVYTRLNQNNTAGGFDLLRSGVGCEPSAVLGHLPRLLTLSPSKTLEFCLEEVKHIRPLDMLYMSRLLNKPLQGVFMPYMLARYSAITQPDEISALCESSVVRLTWLKGLMQEADTSRLMTTDNKPLPGSHLYQWKHKSIITSILDQYVYEDDVLLLDICQQFGYWLGILQILHHLGRRTTGQEMIVRLRDITLLTSEAWYPVSIEEWQHILDTMTSLHSDSDTIPPQSTPGGQKGEWTLTWDSLGLLLAQSVGAERAISLLQTLSLPPEALSLKFYQGLIVTTLGAQKQRSLLHNILEKTDAYLWAKKPTQMAPQIHYAADEERKMVTAVREGRQTQVFKDMFTQLESQTELVTHRFVEDLECHWGVRCDFNRNCPCCGLKLTAQVSLSQPGVLVFHCGHAFHKFCQSEKVCQICQENRNQLQQ